MLFAIILGTSICEHAVYEVALRQNPENNIFSVIIFSDLSAPHAAFKDSWETLSWRS